VGHVRTHTHIRTRWRHIVLQPAGHELPHELLDVVPALNRRGGGGDAEDEGKHEQRIRRLP